MLTLAQFLAAPTGAAITDADFDTARAVGAHLVVVRGSRMRSKAGLLDEVSAALQFPLTFGANWDALADCLTERDRLVLAIAQASQVLTESVAAHHDFTTFVTILADRAIPTLLGVGTDEHPERVRSTWEAAGLPVQPIEEG